MNFINPFNNSITLAIAKVTTIVIIIQILMLESKEI